jgi:hypothetical protein
MNPKENTNANANANAISSCAKSIACCVHVPLNGRTQVIDAERRDMHTAGITGDDVIRMHAVIVNVQFLIGVARTERLGTLAASMIMN